MVDNTENAVKIAVRECPLKNKETFIHYDSDVKNILIANDRAFSFDYIFQSDVGQKEVFNALACPLVRKSLQGYNSSIFAYGQTGTGKTYTMGLTQSLKDDSAGIIPRCLHEIFQAENVTHKKFFVSYIEIYNEKVFDMLSSDPNEQIYIKGCKFSGGNKREIKTADEGLTILIQGNRSRHVRPTKMNAQSSRSHAIFTIHVEQLSDKVLFASMLNLIDLAGSEGVRRTGHQGIALSEGVNINQGLLSVGKVIQALNSGSKVIPYRDSILTSVLQDSLNINSYLTLLACISSEKIDKSETLYTLRFAQNAKSLRNNPHSNEVLLQYHKLKQKTSKMVTPLRIKNSFTPYTKNKNMKFTNSLKKSNSFCSPRKFQRIDFKKFNDTDIQKKFKSPNLEIRSQGYETVNCNSNGMKLSIESRCSLTSLLNVSTSTILEAPVPTTNDLDLISKKKIENFLESVESNGGETSKAEKEIQNQPHIQFRSNSFWDSMKEDLRDIIREEITKISNKNVKMCSLHKMDEQNEKDMTSNTSNLDSSSVFSKMKDSIRDLIQQEILILTEVKTDMNFAQEQGQIIDKTDNRQYQVFQDNLLFKIPDSLSISRRDVEPNSLLNSTRDISYFKQSQNLSKLFNTSQELETSNILNLTTQSSIPSIPQQNHRLSKRINKAWDSLKHKNLRRSSRLEAQHSSIEPLKIEKKQAKIEITKAYKVQNKLRRSCRLEEKTSKNFGSSQTQKKQNKIGIKESLKTQSKENVLQANEIISSYFNNNKSTEIKNISKAKHQKAVLEILNNGTIKELQILPYIGLKTAYQIIINRTLNGKFKNFEVVSKLPVWRGTAWNRFKEANNL